MKEPSDALNRIRDGAISAIARHGVRKLSMVDVGNEARVSRGTLYRYFTSRADLLTSVQSYVRDSFEHAIGEAVAADPDLDHRVDVVIDAVFEFGRRPEFARILESEPNLVRDFLRNEFDRIVAPVARALAPATSDDHLGLPRLDPWSVAEVLIRLCYSLAQVRPSDIPVAAETLHRVVNRLLGRVTAEPDDRWDEVATLDRPDTGAIPPFA